MIESLVDVLEMFWTSKLKNVHTTLPGTIESYSGHGERKAKVKIAVRLRFNKSDPISIPPIENVPVIFPSSGKFNFLFPLNKGDGCEIRFSEEGIGAFLKGKTEVDADSFAKFALTDAICTPGLWSFSKVPQDPLGSIIVENDGTIVINKGSNGVARLNDSVQINDSAFATWVTAVSTFINGLAPGTLIPPFPTTPTGIITSASTKVKAG